MDVESRLGWPGYGCSDCFCRLSRLLFTIGSRPICWTPFVCSLFFRFPNVHLSIPCLIIFQDRRLPSGALISLLSDVYDPLLNLFDFVNLAFMIVEKLLHPSVRKQGLQRTRNLGPTFNRSCTLYAEKNLNRRMLNVQVGKSEYAWGCLWP